MKVYIIMEGMHYEYDNILKIYKDYTSAKNKVEELIEEYEKEWEEKYIETSEDFWEYKDTKYISIGEYTVY